MKINKINENVINIFLPTILLQLRLLKNSFVSFFNGFRQDIQKAFNTK